MKEQKNEKKVKFEKPVFYAQNSGAGSFAATCPPNVGAANGFNGNSLCVMKCRNCSSAI